MEQDNLYDTQSDAVVYATALPLHYCPTRRPPTLYGNTSRIDYAANCGSTTSAGNTDGIIIEPRNPPIRLAMVTDGTSNTLMIGEKQLHPRLLGDAAPCCDDNEPPYNIGWEADMVRQGSTPPAPDRDHPDTAGSDDFGSRHPSGMNGVYVDGSVHFITWSVEPAVFRNLCVRNDGNVLTNIP
jgi:prepilin-type processing-associated H-X9-DG protein